MLAFHSNMFLFKFSDYLQSFPIYFPNLPFSAKSVILIMMSFRRQSYMKVKLLLFLNIILMLSVFCCAKNSQPLSEKTEHADAVTDFNTLDYYRNKKIGLVYNYGTDDDLTSLVPAENLKYYNSEGDLIAALSAGKVDAVCIDELIAKRMAARNPRLKYSDAILRNRMVGFVFNKQDPTHLIDKINPILHRFITDGTVDAIARKWASDDDSQKIMPVQDWDTSNGIIRFGGEFTSDPIGYIKDGGFVGLDLELLMMIARELHMGVSVTDIPFDALMPAVESGKVDMAGTAISWTEERAESVDFSELYIRDPNVFIILDKDAALTAAEQGGFFTSLKESLRKNFIVESRWKLIVSGIKVTLILSFFSGIFGLLLGFGLCMLRRTGRKVPDTTCKGFVALIQGTPVVVLLMVLYYIVFGSIDISGMVVAVIGFSLNFGAYTCEILRSGLNSIDAGQSEAALALGYTKFQTFWKILFPQAAIRFIPVLKGEFISMVKMTSVVGYIAVQDLTKTGDIIRSRTMEAFFPLIVTAILYFVIAWLLTTLLGFIEKGINPKRRRR